MRRFPAAALEAFIARALAAVGLPEAEAGEVGRLMTRADLRGADGQRRRAGGDRRVGGDWARGARGAQRGRAMKRSAMRIVLVSMLGVAGAKAQAPGKWAKLAAG